MGAPTISAVIAAVVAIVCGYFTYRSSTQANRISDRKVDGEAYDRAQALTDKAIDQLRAHVDWLERQLKERDIRNEELERRIREMRATIDKMERQQARMRALLQQAGIAMPDDDIEAV